MSPEAQLDLVLRLLVALLLGAGIGLERELRGHAAGVRTMAMVSTGSALFTALGGIHFPGQAVDPTRIAAQIVTGVGFLGAGAIFRADDGVKGLTTAAAVWVVAAIGMAAGFGVYLVAALGTLMVVTALVGIRPLENRYLRKAPHPLRRQEDQPDV